MKRFEFKLQPLLNYRAYLEKLARQDAAKARLELLECEKRINSLKEELRRSAGRIDRLASKGVSAGIFKQFTNYMDAVDRDMGAETLRKASLAKVLEQKIEMLKNKTRDKKAMERLREKKEQAHVKEMLREEQKTLDEISSLKKAREAFDGIQ